MQWSMQWNTRRMKPQTSKLILTNFIFQKFSSNPPNTIHTNISSYTVFHLLYRVRYTKVHVPHPFILTFQCNLALKGTR